MMAEGYEQGFGFLPGVAIDQHFTQRNRQSDMESLKRAFPQLLGIGIDESTAILVRGSKARVIGANSAYIYDSMSDDDTDRGANEALSAGDVYDLRSGRLGE
jgi:cyanophycinase-like exopeptidase